MSEVEVVSLLVSVLVRVLVRLFSIKLQISFRSMFIVALVVHVKGKFSQIFCLKNVVTKSLVAKSQFFTTTNS